MSIRKKVELQVILRPVRIQLASSARDGKKVFLCWRRGAKKQNAGESEHTLCKDRQAEFAENDSKNMMKFQCTFTTTRSGEFEEKKLILTLREEINQKKSLLIGSSSINLAEYVKEGINKVIKVSIDSKNESSIIEFQIQTAGLATSISNPAKKARRSLSGSKRRSLLKVQYEIVPIQLDNLPKSLPSHSKLFVKWERGSKKSNQGRTSDIDTLKPVWPSSEQPISLTSSLQKKSNGSFSTKNITFHVMNASASNNNTTKPKAVAKAQLNLAEFINHREQKEVSVPLQGISGNLKVILKSTLLQYEGKKILEKSNPAAASIKEFVKINGKEYALQPREGGSIIEDDDDDEDDDLKTDFDDDDDDDSSIAEGSNVAIRTDRILRPVQQVSQKSQEENANKLALRKQLEEADREYEALQQTLQQVQLKRKKQLQNRVEVHSNFDVSDEAAELLENIEKLEAQLVISNSTTLACQRELLDAQTKHKAIEQEQQVIGDLLQRVPITIDNIKSEMQSLLKQHYALKQQAVHLQSVMEDYGNVDQKGGKKAQADTVFEEHLKIYKKCAQKSKADAEALEKRVHEAERDRKELAEDLAASLEDIENAKKNSVALFQKQIYFLRKLFLCGSREFDGDTPVCTNEILNFIDENQCEPEWIMEVLIMIRLMARNSGSDLDWIAFWLSVGVHLMKQLQGFDEYQIEQEIEHIGIIEIDTDSIRGSPTFFETFSLLFYDIYLMTINQIHAKLDQFMDISFVSSNVMIIDSTKTISDPSRSMEELIGALKSVLKSLTKARIYPIIIKQFLHQLIYYISVNLFNSLVQNNGALCSPTTALRIKMGISFLEAWLAELNQEHDNLFANVDSRPFRDHLKYIVEGVNVMIIAPFREDVFESEESLKSLFPSLNVVQIRRLLQNFTPDKNGDKIPDGVFAKIDQLCKDVDISNMSETLSPILKLEQFSSRKEENEENSDESGSSEDSD